MSVKELIEMLNGFEQEAEVIMQKDGEGNEHSPLAGLWFGRYRADSTWSSEVGLAGLDDELRERGYTEEDVMEDGVAAVILSPTN